MPFHYTSFRLLSVFPNKSQEWRQLSHTNANLLASPSVWSKALSMVVVRKSLPSSAWHNAWMSMGPFQATHEFPGLPLSRGTAPFHGTKKVERILLIKSTQKFRNRHRIGNEESIKSSRRGDVSLSQIWQAWVPARLQFAGDPVFSRSEQIWTTTETLG